MSTHHELVEFSEIGSGAFYRGDCMATMHQLLAQGYDGSFDAVVTDPPYGLGFMGKSWDSERTIAFQAETWSLALRLLKPGGHLVAFGGSRTYHRLAVAVEDAGFEVRDQILWTYGSGFPKSHDVSKAIDKALGGLGTFGEPKSADGYGTALKPAHEPAVLARKPLEGTVAENVLKYGTGALNIGGCRIPGSKPATTRGAGGQHGAFSPLGSQGRIEDDGQGRWPANLLHDGSPAMLAEFAKAGESKSPSGGGAARFFATCEPGPDDEAPSGNADVSAGLLMHYCAKAPKSERGGSKHPTVKPLSLMRYLVRLVCPPGGTVLDPFSGSGSTLEAAILEGRQAVGCELTPDYWPDIEARLRRCQPELEAAKLAAD